MRSSGKFIVRHKEFDKPLDDLSDVIAKNFLEDITKLANQYIPQLEKTTARQYLKALAVYASYHRTLHSSATLSPVSSILLAGLISQHNKSDWIIDMIQFTDHLKSQYKENAVTQHISGMNWWFEKMATKRICPAGLKISNTKRKGKGVSTIVEFPLTKEAELAIQSQLETDKSAGDLTKEARLLYSHICVSLKKNSVDEISIDDLPLLTQAVLQKRLSELRTHAQLVFNRARVKRLEGLSMARRGRKAYLSLMCDWLNWRKGKETGSRNPWTNEIHKLNDQDFIDAHIAWCFDEHELRGLGPKSEHTDTRIYNLIRKEIQRRDLQIDAKQYQELLGASHDLLVSAYLLLINDLVANPGSIAVLKVDADYKTFDGIAGVDWEKKRAGRFLTMLDSKHEKGFSPASKVVAVVRRATRHYRMHCIPADQEKLFLLNYQNSTSAKGRRSGKPISAPSLNWFNTHTKAMIQDCSGGEWVGTALSLRASLLLLSGLKHGVLAAQDDAQHSSARTTTGYLNKLPMALLLDQKIRKFMEWMEALVAIDISDFAEKVGIDPVEFENRKQEVLDSHFGGLHCSDNLSGIQPGSIQGQPCTQISKCITCEKRRNLFVASENNVLHMLLWNDALVKAERKGLISRNGDWLLWAAFIEGMLERLQSNLKHKAILEGAKQHMDKQTNNPYYRVFEYASV